MIIHSLIQEEHLLSLIVVGHALCTGNISLGGLRSCVSRISNSSDMTLAVDPRQKAF